jgi:hypothetical protein
VRTLAGAVFALLALISCAFTGFWLWSYLRNRPALRIDIRRPTPAPHADAMVQGFRFALSESPGRAGRFLVEARLDPGEDEASCTFGLQEGPRLAPLGAVDPDRRLLLPSTRQLAEAALAWAAGEGLSSMALVVEEDDRSQAMAAALNARLDPLRLVEAAARPPLIVHAGETAPFSSATKRFRELRQAGFEGRFLVLDAHPEISFVDAPGRVHDGMLLISPLSPPPAEFVPRFRAFAGKDPGPHVFGGYLAGKAAQTVISASASTEPYDLQAAAERVGLWNAAGETLRQAPSLYEARNGRFVFLELLPLGRR